MHFKPPPRGEVGALSRAGWGLSHSYTSFRRKPESSSGMYCACFLDTGLRRHDGIDFGTKTGARAFDSRTLSGRQS